MQRALCSAEVSSEEISLGRSGYSAAVECSVPSLAEVSGKGCQFGLLGHEKGRAVKSSTPFVRKKRLTCVYSSWPYFSMKASRSFMSSSMRSQFSGGK